MRYDMYDDPKYQELSQPERHLLCYLLNRQGKNDSTWVSVGTMVKDTKLSRSAVFAALATLRSGGFVERYQDGGRTHTKVHLMDRGVHEVDPPVQQVDTGVQVVDPTRPAPAPKVKEKNKKKPKENIYTPEFEEWYEHYPRKVNKPAAAKAYLSAAEKTDQATLIAGIQSIDASEPKYIPHPSTWLNGERWNDAPTPKKRTIFDVYDDAKRQRNIQPTGQHPARLDDGHLQIVADTTTSGNGRHAVGQDESIGRGTEQVPSRATPRSVHIPVKRMPGVAGRKP